MEDKTMTSTNETTTPHTHNLDSPEGIARLVADIGALGRTANVLDEVAAERARQDAKWGEQNHPDFYAEADQGATQQEYAGMADSWKEINAARVAEQNAAGVPSDRNAAWDGVLLEEVYEALAESNPAELRAELVQVAAVAVAWVEAIDRRGLSR